MERTIPASGKEDPFCKRGRAAYFFPKTEKNFGFSKLKYSIAWR
jgi:hypothetical protein